MNKSELCKTVAARTNLPLPVATAAVTAMFAAVTDTLGRGEPVAVLGFGTWEVHHREATTRMSFGELRDIPATNVIRFKAGTSLKGHVNQPPVG